MNLIGLRDTLTEEVQAMLSPRFVVSVAEARTVPGLDDSDVTFPDLTRDVQRCKRIRTCVLYVDIRESTRLNLDHQKTTLAPLYSAFIRAMSQCAVYFGGKVRNIVGDRLMVVFDELGCHANAVNTAVLMNSVVRYVLNPQFRAGEFRCGIGVDYGPMLIAKAGLVKQGGENIENKSLVWLGRPANVASRLTDQANTLKPIYGLQPLSPPQHYPPILISQAVFDGYMASVRRSVSSPGDVARVHRRFTPVKVRIPSVSVRVYGTHFIFPELQTKPTLPVFGRPSATQQTKPPLRRYGQRAP